MLLIKHIGLTRLGTDSGAADLTAPPCHRPRDDDDDVDDGDVVVVVVAVVVVEKKCVRISSVTSCACKLLNRLCSQTPVKDLAR